MYSEYVAMDMTFGTNLQKRPLFIVNGVDGNNKMKTFFRCFMPSKQAQAYRWVINKAMPTLLGGNLDSTFPQVSMIATDEEDALISTIRSQCRPAGIFPNSRHRLDKYHLFIKVWKNEGVLTSKTNDAIFKCIDSWFHQLETLEEYTNSYRWLIKYLPTNKQDISEKNILSIQDIVQSIHEKITYCGHHHFLNCTTLGFVGDSVCEAANSALKGGRLGVSGRHSIENSALRQVQMTQEREKRLHA